MSFNLVDLIKDQVGGAVTDQIGGLLGDQSGLVKSGIDSAVPALLSGLSERASLPGGADTLFNSLQNHDDGLLDNLSSAIGGNSKSLIESGTGLLGGLLGNNGLGSLAGMLSGFTGLTRGNTGSLLGMLAPIVMGVLKRKVIGGGLNPAGMLDMLNLQKNNVQAAMPQGLSDQLSASGFLGSIAHIGSDTLESATGAVSNLADSASGAAANLGEAANSAAGAAVDTAGNAAAAVTNEGSSLFKKLLPIIGILLLGWLAFKFFGNSAKDAADTAADAAGSATSAVTETAGNAAGAAADTASNAAGAVTDAASNAVATATDAAGNAAGAVTDAASNAAGAVTDAASNAAGAVTDAASGAVATATDAAGNLADAANINVDDLGGQLTGMFDSAKTSLEGITDVQTAESSLPALQGFGTQLNDVASMIEGVPEAARGPLTSIVQNGMGILQPLLEKLRAIPGVGAIIDPVMTPIVEKLQGLGG